MIEAMAAMDNANKSSRKIIPISVKTRIGYDKIAAEEWAKHSLKPSLQISPCTDEL